MKTKSYDQMIQERRKLLKSTGIEYDEWASHQRRGVSPPPLEKSCSEDGILIEMLRPDGTNLGGLSLAKAISQRESRRKYTSEPLKLEELSFLLWATQGVKSVDTNKVWTRRTVPSGGSRHPFETY
jgi:hypothetical protein